MFLTVAWGSYLFTGDSRVPSGPFFSEGQHAEKTQQCQEAWPVSTESHGDSSPWPAGVDISAAPIIGC